MKKLDLFIVLLILSLLLALTSCDVLMGTDGSDGKVYVELSIDDYAQAYYVYIDAFPDGGYFNTYYEVEEGTYWAEYAFSYSYYDSYNGEYRCLINSWDSFWVDSSPIDPLDGLNQFLSVYGYVETFSVTVTANSGTAGGLFKDGTNGADKYYSVYLAWDVYDSYISSNGVELEKTLLPSDDGSTILQFKDEYRTFTLTFPEKSVVSERDPSSAVRAVK